MWRWCMDEMRGRRCANNEFGRSSWKWELSRYPSRRRTIVSSSASTASLARFFSRNISVTGRERERTAWLKSRKLKFSHARYFWIWARENSWPERLFVTLEISWETRRFYRAVNHARALRVANCTQRFLSYRLSSRKREKWGSYRSFYRNPNG